MPETIAPIGNTWATCYPMNFRGCEIYANRDSGLVTQGFLANGLQCRSILLAPNRDGDLTNIIRATRDEMENPKWWAVVAQRGVVFYNCSKLIQAPVLHAAKAAGLPIAINVDNAAIFDFQSNPREFWLKAIRHKSHLPKFERLARALASVFKNYYRRFTGRHYRLAEHLAIADVIGGVTPDAVVRLRRFLERYGQPKAAARVHLIPHPAHPRFVTRGQKPNEGEITFVTVGRWDDHVQKRPDLLMAVIDSLLACDPRTNFRIFGKLTSDMRRWHEELKPEARSRIVMHGVVPNNELLDAYQTAHIYLCVSAYESFLIAAAEAMCCGCSIVACDSPTLPGPRWFASESRGTLSDRLDSRDLANSSLVEAEAWRLGRRNGQEIAAWAQEHMHAHQVAKSYARLLAEHRS